MPDLPQPREPGDLTRPRRLNIAVLLDHLNFFGRGYEGQLREALHKRCMEPGHNVLFLYGGALDAPDPPDSFDNVLFRILNPAAFDGVVLASSLISAFCGEQGVARLAERYMPARLCSIGIAIPGVPSILLDNRVGMAQVTEHLVTVHGCRRPVFLAGTPCNPESEERLLGHREVLERHGIPFDPTLVASGHFLPALGREAMDGLLDKGATFDSVVAANDSMAMGAIQALRKRGVRVPQDIPVAGFDDIALAKLGNPPLTTVAQPFDTFADLAIAAVEDQVLNRAVPLVTRVPTQFVRRQSCGCGHWMGAVKVREVEVPPGIVSAELTQHMDRLLPILTDVLKSTEEDGSAAAERLCRSVVADIHGQGEGLRATVEAMLEDVDDVDRHRCLQSAIHILRNEIANEVPAEIEKAFYEAFSHVALSSTAAQVRHRLELDETYLRLLDVGELSSGALDYPSLRDALVRGLPSAGVRTALLSCPVAPGSPELESVVWYAEGMVHDPLQPHFPTGRLVHPGKFKSDRRNSLLVFPLVEGAEFLGTVAFDHQDGTNAYIAFRNQIATVLRHIRAHQDVLRKRLDALSVLAGGVAHELNNTLGPLLSLPDVIASQLIAQSEDVEKFDGVLGDLECIKGACLKASTTIKDLLTMSRQGRMPKKSLDFNAIVRACTEDSSLRTMFQGKQIRLTVGSSNVSLPVRGADSQLARAVSNLIQRAAEAIPESGDIFVGTARELLPRNILGIETIPRGDYVVLRVRDNGHGIPQADLAHVFEPFFIKSTATPSSSALGLAIVHGVIKEHAGFIDVHSTPADGTTFTVYLPVGPEDVRASGSRPAVNHRFARILVVDDEPMQLRVCHRLLTRMGYSVETLPSGRLACELFEQARTGGKSPFDLVLMDMILGEGQDGLQVIQRIWESFPHQRFLIVSGHASNEIAERAGEHGLPWLAKPYTVDALAVLVAELLSRT